MSDIHSLPCSKKCNTEIDCDDASDETNCDYLLLGKSYAKELIPREAAGDAAFVYINISVLAIPSIDTVNLKFTSDIFLSLRCHQFILCQSCQFVSKKSFSGGMTYESTFAT
jgi:hypothetical protein